MHYMRKALQHVNLNVIDRQLILDPPCLCVSWRMDVEGRLQESSLVASWRQQRQRVDPELSVLTFSSTCRVRSASGQRGDLRLSVVYRGSQDVLTALCNETHETGNTISFTALLGWGTIYPGTFNIEVFSLTSVSLYFFVTLSSKPQTIHRFEL